MNKLEKIKKLKEEISNEMKEDVWGWSGRHSYEILTDILSLMEEDAKDVKQDALQDVCCGKFETCNEACVPRANYFKENSRVQLNKLALSILKESLKDQSYRFVWEANLETALYDAVRAHRSDHVESWNITDTYGKDMAKIFMNRLFGEIE